MLECAVEVSKIDVVNSAGFKSEEGDPTPVADGGEGAGGDLDSILRDLGVSPDILDRVIEIATGPKKDAREWQNNEWTVRQFLKKITVLREGRKEGEGMLSGAVVKSPCQRVAKNQRANYVQFFDFDNGESLDEIASKVEKQGWFALLYTTWSHLRPETEIAEDKIVNWRRERGLSGPVTNRDLADYLIDAKKVKASIFASLKDANASARREHREGGVKYISEHAPLPRVRAMFLLKDPFVFAQRGGTQKQAIEEWSDLCRGVAVRLDVVADSSCVDPSHFMFTPRRPKGSPVGEGQHEVLIINGTPLDLDSIPHVSSRPGRATGDRFSAFETTERSGKTTQGGQRTEFKTPNLLAFLRIARNDFEAADWAQSVGIEPRHEHPDGMDCACPFEDNHTTPDSKDRAFSIRNASGNATGAGFSAWCLHDGCKTASGGDRAWYLDEMLQQAGIEDAMDLISPEWTPNVWREREVEKQKGTGGSATSGALSAVYVTADQLEAKPVKWVFADHLPKGCASLLVGPTKVGKSQQAIHMVACVTTGRPLVPGGPSTVPAKAVLITAEDAHAEVVVPRLEAAGADMSKVVIVQGMVETSKDGTVTERALSLETAATALADVLAAHPDVVLVVVDPVNAHLGKIDARENNKVRAAMQPLISMADKHGLSVLLVHHMRKDTDTSNLLDMSGGSNAFVEATRTVFVCVPVNKERPEEDGAIFEVARSSYARSGQRYLYHIEPVDLPPWGISTSRVVFSTEKAPMSAAQAVLGNNKREDATELERAVEFLGGYLGDGNEHDADEVRAAAKKQNISHGTLYRARLKLEVDYRGEGFGPGRKSWLKMSKTARDRLFTCRAERAASVLCGED